MEKTRRSKGIKSAWQSGGHALDTKHGTNLGIMRTHVRPGQPLIILGRLHLICQVCMGLIEKRSEQRRHLIRAPL
jgi:hypothetical protein